MPLEVCESRQQQAGSRLAASIIISGSIIGIIWSDLMPQNIPMMLPM
jgi:hypothetical protein